MDQAWRLWQSGEYPAHHLWGISHLEQYGIDVDILPHEKFSFLKSTRWSWRFGDLDQQLRILARFGRYDLVYSACQSSTNLLAKLRYRGLFRPRLVAILHRPTTDATFVLGHDRLICLSDVVRQQMIDLFPESAEKLTTLHWCVDISFYSHAYNHGEQPRFILATGKANRDYATLVQAFAGINYPLLVSCDRDSAPKFPDIPENVTIRTQFVDYSSLLNDYRSAYAVAIPLLIPESHAVSQIGITSLLEAMAMGKAVIMTRNRQLDIDIEQEGIGLWVEPGDVAGWERSIRRLLSQPEETKRMGQRGRLLCEQKFDINTFTCHLAQILRDQCR